VFPRLGTPVDMIAIVWLLIVVVVDNAGSNVILCGDTRAWTKLLLPHFIVMDSVSLLMLR
jgi:hypothetical protein